MEALRKLLYKYIYFSFLLLFSLFGMISDYTDAELHQAILDGEFTPEGISYIKNHDIYIVKVGGAVFRGGLRSIRGYLELFDKYLTEELDNLNSELYGDS